jgi:quercetin dioxygenase-like cupin family protein
MVASRFTNNGKIMTPDNVQNLDNMVDQALSALAAGGTEQLPLFEGRIVAVFATPSKKSSEDMAMGISALPADYSAPVHSHRAEEFALVLRGKGKITINGDEIIVGPGSLVVTPPNAPHFTTVNPGEPMAIYWVYSPAGSESRWQKENLAESSK